MKILLDTNVLVDYLLSRKPFDDNARKIILLCKSKKIDGCIAAHSFLNIFYILRKDLTADERRILLKDFCTFVEVAGIDKNKIITALDNNAFSDFEDCLQSECAKDFSADYIVTRNTKDFKNSTVPAITPDEFLERIKI